MKRNKKCVIKQFYDELYNISAMILP